MSQVTVLKTREERREVFGASGKTAKPQMHCQRFSQQFRIQFYGGRNSNVPEFVSLELSSLDSKVGHPKSLTRGGFR